MRASVAVAILTVLIMSPPMTASEAVILLHGLCRSPRSMSALERRLTQEGFAVANVGYPSRSASIAELAQQTIAEALSSPRVAGASRIHFVTHSMGGILVRQYLASRPIERLGRVVMLGPPNQGSEIVDALGGLKVFGWLNGPAGRELGTSLESVPNRLGPVGFELGVIAGDRSINWINSLIIPGPDDGKVSVARTGVAGMKAHRVIHATHPFLMRNREAISLTLHFLKHGVFAPQKNS